jgi:hypothetical protein
VEGVIMTDTFKESCKKADAELRKRRNKKAADDGGDEKRLKQATVIVGQAAGSSLFHNADGTAFASIPVKGRTQTWPVRSGGFRRWLVWRYFRAFGSPPNNEALQSALAVLEARATFEGPECAVHVRVGSEGGKLYLDIGDDSWSAVEIDASGWRIVTSPPIRFVRSRGVLPLPIPVKGGSIQLLRPFCNVCDDGFVLLVAVLLAGLRAGPNFPVLILSGEQGCGKSSQARCVVGLTDPHIPEQRSMPRSEEDLLVAAKGAHVLSFDNVSGLPDWLSDAICRLSTGGGAGKRKLYSDEDEILFSGRRLIILNGIEDVAVRPDLIDRSVLLALEPIPEKECRTEEEFNQDFARVAPEIIGALLDGVVHGLRNLASVKVAGKPRMADFALWAEACTRAYWPAGTFLRAYQENVGRAVELMIEASDVAEAVRVFMAGRNEWSGTASELLPLLTELVPERTTKQRTWPKQANTLSGKLRRVAPPLRKIGINITFDREAHSGKRLIHIRVPRPTGERGERSPPSSPASPRKANLNKTNGQGEGDGNGEVTMADCAVTMADKPPSAPNLLNEQQTSHDGDDGDDVLHAASSDGHGAHVPSDIDAIYEELAARGEPLPRRLRPPWSSGWHPIGDLPPGQAMGEVFVREIWPPALGPAGDDLLDIDERWWRQ